MEKEAAERELKTADIVREAIREYVSNGHRKPNRGT